MLLCTCVDKYLFEPLLSFLEGIYPEVELLAYGKLDCNFLRNHQLSATAAAAFSGVWGPGFLVCKITTEEFLPCLNFIFTTDRENE